MSGSTKTMAANGAPGERWSRRSPHLAAGVYGLAYVLVSVAGYLLSRMGLPSLPQAVLALVVWIGTLVLSLLLVLSICRFKMGPGAEALWLLATMALFLLARPDVFAVAGRWLGYPAWGRGVADALMITPGQQLLGNVALILWAIFLGRLVSRVIREGKLLLPVAVVASIADTITVFWGVVATLAEKAPEVVETFSAQAPVMPPPAVPVPILTSVGIGDFLFLAVFLTVAVRYAMDAGTAMWLTFAIMLVVPAAFIIWPTLPGLPGLPFISLAVLGVNRKHFTFTPQEKRALAFAGILVLAVAAWLILRH